MDKKEALEEVTELKEEHWEGRPDRLVYSFDES